MVRYEGQVTKDGNIVVNLGGELVSLREFLQATRMKGRGKAKRVRVDRRQSSGTGLAVAK